MFKNILKIVFAVTIILACGKAQAYDCSEPKAYVSSVRDAVLGVINGKGSDAEKHSQLNKVFRETADTEWMSKFVMGRNYSKLTPEQQKEYAGVYTDYLSASYVDRFRQYNGEEIVVNSVKPVNSDFNVDTTIQRAGKASVNVTYRIRKAGSCYKVADISAEGVSLINTQRQDFTSSFGSRGYDGLIQLLKDKTQQINNSGAE